MPVPAEYQRIRDDFYDFLLAARDDSGLWSTHVSYTMAQAVFQVFRRRLSLDEAIGFANILPAGMRALFVADWNPQEPIKEFGSSLEMEKEVKSLRPNHNFSPDGAIPIVARAVRQHVDPQKLDALLKTFPHGAEDFFSGTP